MFLSHFSENTLHFLNVFLLVYAFNSCTANLEQEYCDIEDLDCKDSNIRYLFYDVNPPEGFNLRRDVYMRYAVFARNLQQTESLKNFRLVLPPWSNLYHWKQKDEPDQIPWSYFFDIKSLRNFAPVIEMHEFFDAIEIRYPPVVIEEVYVLQHYSDMFESGNFEERMSLELCQKDIQTSFFYYSNITSHNLKCLSFHGHASQLAEILEKSNAKTILFDHAEVALHDRFGDALYWQARRSMRFNRDLKNIAGDFREKFLNSTDDWDGTYLPEDWRQEKGRRNARGGPYLAVHLRRRDFVWGRRNEVPSLTGAAKQIRKLLLKLNLGVVFVATDAPDKEFEELEILLTKESGDDYKIYRYKPNKSIKKKYKDGGVAIIDQIICSYARYFIGSYESTFSFRIQEEREILGFPAETTFNRLCGDKEENCQRPSMWKIVH